MKITVLYNKPSQRFLQNPQFVAAEDDTELSAIEVRDALVSKGAEVTVVAVTEFDFLQKIQSIRADLIFNLLEWTGVDTRYAMEAYDVLNKLPIPYTGATKESYFESCDKTLLKQHLDSVGLPTAPWQLFVTGQEPVRADFHYPVLIKVSMEHSSVGLGADAIAHNALEVVGIVHKRLYEYRQPVYAEELLSGREFQVTVFEHDGVVTVLPPAEIVYNQDGLQMLSYASRWDEKSDDYKNSTIELAKLDSALLKSLTDMSLRAFSELSFRDYARFDIRCTNKGLPMFLELNSNPGLGDDEEYGMTISYQSVGMTFADFVWSIVESAMKRSEKKSMLEGFRRYLFTGFFGRFKFARV